LLLHRQLLALEQDLLDLLRRAEVEGLAGGLERLLLQREDLLAQRLALRVERAAVEQHAVPLHAKERRHERQLDALVDEGEFLVPGNARMHDVVQREDAVRLLRRVLRGAADVDRAERDARGALAGDLLEGERGPPAM